MHIDDKERVIGFLEKPADPPPMPGRSDLCLASMGIYVFTARPMYEWLCQDATRTDSTHDFGKDIVPRLIDATNVYAFRFRGEWIDIGDKTQLLEADNALRARAGMPVRDAYSV